MEWWQLGGLLEHLPRDSAVAREMLGDEADWTVDTHIAAYIADGIWVANWQRSAGKKKDYPTPIKRPGDEKKTRGDDTVLKSRSRTFAEIDALLAPFGPGGDDVSHSR